MLFLSKRVLWDDRRFHMVLLTGFRKITKRELEVSFIMIQEVFVQNLLRISLSQFQLIIYLGERWRFSLKITVERLVYSYILIVVAFY